MLVHRYPKTMAFTSDGDEQLVQVSDVTETTLSPPQSPGIGCSKLPAPESNRFVEHRVG